MPQACAVKFVVAFDLSRGANHCDGLNRHGHMVYQKAIKHGQGQEVAVDPTIKLDDVKECLKVKTC